MRMLVLLGLVVGCGSGDKLTSVAESKKLSELSNDDMKQLCEDMKVYKNKKKVSDDDNIKISCNAQAVMTVARAEAKDDAALRAECKKVLETCLAKKAKMPESKDIDCNDKKFSGEMAECDATVGELTACVGDMNAVMKKFAADDPCAQLKAGDKDGITNFFDKMKSPKCDAMEKKCKKGGGKKSAGGGGGGDDALAKEALTKVEEFKTRMCACKDKACADGVNETMTKWGTEMAKQANDSKPDAAIAKKMTDAMTSYAECMTKLMMESVPAPPAAPKAP